MKHLKIHTLQGVDEEGRFPYIYRRKASWIVKRRCPLTKKEVHHKCFKTQEEAIAYVRKKFKHV